ncbi:hypothetical protein C1H76_1092 [Elsinoe australis]|uniref:Cyclochlorotine biosynthesis protein O n=1 Tax=Elsinoe australis TaxID=40998 RepID=A0A4U7BA68_9PEZI|nr:hypothetical protein C1H76_1092 [Elsinoe australis]
MPQAHVSEDDSDVEQTARLLGNHTSEANHSSLTSKTYVLYPLLLLAFSSPANEAVEYLDYDFNNMFSHKSEYRGPPTVELEKRWQELWDYGETNIPKDKLHLLLTAEKAKKQWKTLPEEKGGGYAVALGVFHQLHCLDYIRWYTWGDYYERHNLTNPQKNSAVGNRMHVDHCIEELRKTLMCYGDTTPMLVEIDPSAPIGERSDFDSRHRCRNYEKIRSWMVDHLAIKWPSV